MVSAKRANRGSRHRQELAGKHVDAAGLDRPDGVEAVPLPAEDGCVGSAGREFDDDVGSRRITPSADKWGSAPRARPSTFTPPAWVIRSSCTVPGAAACQPPEVLGAPEADEDARTWTGGESASRPPASWRSVSAARFALASAPQRSPTCSMLRTIPSRLRWSTRRIGIPSAVKPRLDVCLFRKGDDEIRLKGDQCFIARRQVPAYLRKRKHLAWKPAVTRHADHARTEPRLEQHFGDAWRQRHNPSWDPLERRPWSTLFPGEAPQQEGGSKCHRHSAARDPAGRTEALHEVRCGRTGSRPRRRGGRSRGRGKADSSPRHPLSSGRSNR